MMVFNEGKWDGLWRGTHFLLCEAEQEDLWRNQMSLPSS